MDRDEVLVKLVEHESIIWKRNHPQFKNVTMKEQAWGRVAYQLGILSESLYVPHTQTMNHPLTAFCINTLPLRFILVVRMKFCVNPITGSHTYTHKRPNSTHAHPFNFVIATQLSIDLAKKKGFSLSKSVCA